MHELWEKNGLIDKREWGKLIDSCKQNNFTGTKKEAQTKLQELLLSSVRKRLPAHKFGIFFSGGVDSTFIAAACKLLKGNFVCYAVGFQDETKEPDDIVEAKRVAEKLGFELKYKIFNLEEAKNIITKTVNILQKVERTDVVNVGVGSVVVAAAELGLQDGITHFFSGLGSEEIFAGYERHEKASDVCEECWSGLKNMWSRDLVRDFALAKELGITINTPFLDKELIEFSMTLPSEWKLVDNKKKVILREVAEEFLGEFAWRKKKAAQYGSCFDKAISKLARSEGFTLKKEWLDTL
ncbi:asparagine synthase [Candidatus Woesearchaeota archaeon]|jgi:diphthine-ammonia ligase|nr:asparagine synthase [Candidatus Woesearchaeota archaeon]MBT5396840.1 asparagine synthase [Candidatus Woesearchaeota archaeon]MBT5924154.1 asparagine synthase [Candidatus Woesearchaeota archaeon]MBT6367728.1 asparagine synthase [Candidatus Woesearchaeota archaeon]MBT7762871.1 asparagine synthase [Candidatus Woesearchaeota archaeon]